MMSVNPVHFPGQTLPMLLARNICCESKIGDIFALDELFKLITKWKHDPRETDAHGNTVAMILTGVCADGKKD